MRHLLRKCMQSLLLWNSVVLDCWTSPPEQNKTLSQRRHCTSGFYSSKESMPRELTWLLIMAMMQSDSSSSRRCIQRLLLWSLHLATRHHHHHLGRTAHASDYVYCRPSALDRLPGKRSLSLCRLNQPLHADDATKWVDFYLVCHESFQMTRQILQSEQQPCYLNSAQVLRTWIERAIVLQTAYLLAGLSCQSATHPNRCDAKH